MPNSLTKMIKYEHPWLDPLKVGYNISCSEFSHKWVFLFSGRRDDLGNGRYSYIALKPSGEIKGDNLAEFSKYYEDLICSQDNQAFGYFAYDLKNDLEALPQDLPSHIQVPKLWWVQYKLIMEFDHQNQRLTINSAHQDDWQWLSEFLDTLGDYPTDILPPKVLSFTSNMTAKSYISNVKAVLTAIENGVVYEANLTRKYFGQLQCEHQFDLFLKLALRSPGQYSAYLRFEDLHVLSSSPEKFISQDAAGNVLAQPIKGTIGIKSADGLKERQELENSEKDRAENLMIVDLMRNDLARNCEVGSIKVPQLFHITSYPHLHHLSSTIVGKKLADVFSLDLIMGCFPPGSMTGAPKIKAMETCTNLEQNARGIYSGAIGWMKGDGSFDLSVVIRTIILHHEKFEFQIGGAVVIDSTPEGELQEIYTKGSAISHTLGIDIAELDKCTDG